MKPVTNLMMMIQLNSLLVKKKIFFSFNILKIIYFLKKTLSDNVNRSRIFVINFRIEYLLLNF